LHSILFTVIFQVSDLRNFIVTLSPRFLSSNYCSLCHIFLCCESWSFYPADSEGCCSAGGLVAAGCLPWRWK